MAGYDKSSKLIKFGEPQLRMMADIQAKVGSPSFSETVRHCIFIAHQKLMGANAAPGGAAKRAAGPMKAAAANAEGYRICELLRGEVEGDEVTGLSCRWKTYDRLTATDVTIGEMSMPFEHLTDDVVDAQYSPSREKVEEVLLAR